MEWEERRASLGAIGGYGRVLGGCGRVLGVTGVTGSAGVPAEQLE